VVFSLLGFVLFYTVLAVIDLVLIVKYVRIGPSAEHDGSIEQPVQATAN
jgi:cytochrome d ubiquinol oxidase subunit I